MWLGKTKDCCRFHYIGKTKDLETEYEQKKVPFVQLFENGFALQVTVGVGIVSLAAIIIKSYTYRQRA